LSQSSFVDLLVLAGHDALDDILPPERASRRTLMVKLQPTGQ
jgi:hypothetical protein